MPHSSERLTRRLVESLWVNWAVAAGTVSAVMLVALFVPKLWMPLPVLALAYFEVVFMRQTEARMGSRCTSMLRVSVLTLFWTAITMLVINILNSRMLLNDYIDWSNSNKDIPFVTCLVVYPMLTLCSLWVMFRGNPSHTELSRYVHDESAAPEGDVAAAIYNREGHYQVQLMLFLSLAMNAVEWWYYFQYYFNVNLNTPDRFFFNYMPLALYGISLFFVWSRYQNLAAVVGPLAATERSRGAMVRFLILAGDHLLLALNRHERWDTPAITFVSQLEANDDNRIRKAFANITGCEEFQTRLLYDTRGNDHTIDMAHYAIFVSDENSLNGDWDQTNWFSLDQIDRLLKNAQLSAELSDEIYRIFTITMAWKTYDREGKRLYPIKHYRPTFRLRDLKDWDVDYSDTSWFAVAENNQDRPFFRTRKFWRKITGSKA